MKQHRKPCNECPFRRASAPGYLGANRVNDFAVLAMIEEPMPCHKKVDYTKPDWQKAQQTAPQCAGRATLWANTCKLPRNPDLLRVEPDRKTVFANIQEFRQHHEQFAVEESDDE